MSKTSVITEIRKAEHRDKQEISEVHAQAIGDIDRSFYSEEQILAWLSSAVPENYSEAIDLNEIYVAEEEGRIVGFGRLFISDPEVKAIYVSPNSWRRGVGTKLLRQLEAIGRDAGISELRLNASLNGKNFYEKNGYIGDEVSSVHIDGVELGCILMCKKL